MKLYRYMQYKYWKETVLSGRFVAQYPSKFDDVFEGVSNIETGNPDLGMRLSNAAFDQFYSILCFAMADKIDADSDLLMWSLYGDKSNGVRICVDIPWSSTRVDRYSVCDEISYDPSVPVLPRSPSVGEVLAKLPYGESMGFVDPASMDVVMRCFFSKHPCWQWENEYRILVSNVETNNFIGFDKTCRRYTVDFLKDCIVGVDFGLRADRREARKDIDEVFRNREDINFRFAVANQQLRKIEYANLSDIDGILSTYHSM